MNSLDDLERRMELGQMDHMGDEAETQCNGEQYTSDQVAEYFHRVYERMAPEFGYKTKEESRVPWENIAPNHRQLMRAVAYEVMREFFPEHILFQ